MDSEGIGEWHWVHKPKHLYLQAHPLFYTQALP